MVPPLGNPGSLGFSLLSVIIVSFRYPLVSGDCHTALPEHLLLSVSPRQPVSSPVPDCGTLVSHRHLTQRT